jgi:hypothetical protein
VLCKKFDGQVKGNVIKINYMILYGGHKSDEYEFGIEFYISTHIMDNLL